jgi:hypothetical protein
VESSFLTAALPQLAWGCHCGGSPTLVSPPVLQLSTPAFCMGAQR